MNIVEKPVAVPTLPSFNKSRLVYFIFILLSFLVELDNCAVRINVEHVWIACSPRDNSVVLVTVLLRA